MLCGVGLVSTLAASITSYFLGQEENAALKELNERMVRVEGLLRSTLAERSLTMEESLDGNHHADVEPPIARTATGDDAKGARA
jgi:hypothetical protein